MFNFFRKRNNNNLKYIETVKKLCDHLPEKYQYVSNQVKMGLIINITDNIVLNNNWKSITCLQFIYDKFKNPKLDFKIKNIVGTQKNDKQIIFDLDIFEGILIGVRANCEDNDIENEINFNFDNIFEEHHLSHDHIVNEIKRLGFSFNFMIEQEKNKLYVIEDLGNGDYIVVDEKMSVYKISHDPYEAVLLEKNLSDYKG